MKKILKKCLGYLLLVCCFPFYGIGYVLLFLVCIITVAACNLLED